MKLIQNKFAITSMLSVVLAGVLYMTSAVAGAATTPFVTTWKTDQNSTSNTRISIPTFPGNTYNYTVNWGDGNTSSNITSSTTHDYSAPGEYQVSITGDFPRVFFNYQNCSELISIDAWGDNAWDSMAYAFSGCENLQINANDTPNLSQVESVAEMFAGASTMNSNINNWNVSNVQSFAGMFQNAESFNGPLNSWDISGASSLSNMFKRAYAFNQPLSQWDLSSVHTTNSMFAFSTSFDQPLNAWDVSNILDMRNMFYGAISFNQPLSEWDTSRVNRMESLFRNAVSFDQDISGWGFGSLGYAANMFNGGRLSGTNYDKLLNRLSDSVTSSDIVFDGGSSTYCTAEPARNRLTGELGWSVYDLGLDQNNCGELDIRFTTGNSGALFENEPANTFVGELVTQYPTQGESFTYSFCEDTSSDASFFYIDGTGLFSNTGFDFENPVDQNGDNVYSLCISSEDSRGFSFQRIVTVAILDEEDSTDQGNTLGTSTDGGSTGSADSDGSSSNGQGQVLGTSEDASENGKVLSSTGIAILTTVLVGTIITLLTFKLRGRSNAK